MLPYGIQVGIAVNSTKKKTPWFLVCMRAIPTERLLLISEVSASFNAWSAQQNPRAVNFGFLDRTRCFLEIAPQLSSRVLSGPHSRPITTPKIW
jgi:hypothetical protein